MIRMTEATPSLPSGLFPAARLAPARWLADGTGHGSPSSTLAGAGEWHPDIGFRGAGEVFANGDEAAGAALALALAQVSPKAAVGEARTPTRDEACFLWVQDRKAIRLGGRPYVSGLPPALRHRIIHVVAASAADALFALEEGVRCRDLAFVIGEVAGNPRELDFTASRRLVLAAERHAVPLWLVRLDARRDLGAARMRWQVSSAPSQTARWNRQAPGDPCWQAELFRARGLRPGTWQIIRHEAPSMGGRDERPGNISAVAAGPGDLAGKPGNRSLATYAAG